MPQAYVQVALEHIRHLSEVIGPRGSTTSQERQAAEYARDVLRNLGIDARLEPFRSARSSYRPFALAFGVALLGGLLYAITRHSAAAFLAAALNALGAWGMFAELDFTDNWMRRLLPTGPSQNVIGVVLAREEPRRRVVLLGHLDTHRTPIFYSSTLWHKLFVALVGGTFVSLIVGAVTYALLTLTGWAGLHWVAGLAAAMQLFAFVMCIHADMTPFSPGANDNASGAATVLALGERLTREPLQHTEVWLVPNGCEELGCYGAAALVEAHPDELRQAYFITLDQVGAGDPGFLSSDGLLRKYPVDPELLDIARQIAVDRPELRAFEHPGIAYTDAALLLKRGFRAFTIDALPRDAAGAVHWHQMSDTVDKIEPDCLGRVHEFVWEMLQRLDRMA
ncbi:MAG TPA: Zn-dependent exopeptidase M28 [Caldilineae bacterium]|nr:Zn-dependent exopeptidase M28 [Caldilineae bacterium]